VNEYSRASLELLPRRVVEGAKSILVFNPFHSFAGTVPLKRLRYVFAFRTEDGRKRYRSDIVVSPVPYETKTQLILPVKGRVLVWDGHDHQSHHRRFDYTRPPFLQLGIKTNSHRYAYDFVVVNDQGLMHPAEPSAGDEWYPGKSDANEVHFCSALGRSSLRKGRWTPGILWSRSSHKSPDCPRNGRCSIARESSLEIVWRPEVRCTS
jgi:hypothetical protein